MEHQNPTAFELKLNEQAVDALKTSASWSFFLAIVGFIGVALMVVMSLFMGSIFSGYFALAGMPSGIGAAMTVFYLLMALLYFFPLYYMMKYATEMKASLQSRNPEMLSSAFTYLKSHHKFLGIMVIVVLSLYILMVIGMVLYFGFAASSALPY